MRRRDSIMSTKPLICSKTSSNVLLSDICGSGFSSPLPPLQLHHLHSPLLSSLNLHHRLSASRVSCSDYLIVVTISSLFYSIGAPRIATETSLSNVQIRIHELLMQLITDFSMRRVL
ncbi:hypothetical protein L2E82_02803 [Cichorium intybus]|uniref:Uncharacterized protein n=1 Tax=Cichorium intybus TaxID=13427 RepID=A0ACB9H2T6_CICIN|nr:hypothetical protein L2E82_02803 [Cichorium intybus]